MFSIWISAKTDSLVFPADQVPEALRTEGATTVRRRAPWFGWECCEQGDLSPHGRDAHAPFFCDPKPNLPGYPCQAGISEVTPPKRSASVLCRLFRAEAGIGSDLQLCKFLVRRDLLGKQGAEYGGDEANGNTDQRRVFEREDGIFLHDVGAQ